MAIFDQWPKLYLGFDVEPEIQILKIIYSLRLSYKSLYTGLHNIMAVKMFGPGFRL